MGLLPVVGLVLVCSGCVAGHAGARPAAEHDGHTATPMPSAARPLDVPPRADGDIIRLVVRSPGRLHGSRATIPAGTGPTYVDVSCTAPTRSAHIGYTIAQADSNRPITSATSIPCDGSETSNTALEKVTHAETIDLDLTGDLDEVTQAYAIVTSHAP